MIEWAIVIPVVVLAHAVAAGFLAYSLEKVNGTVSKAWARFKAAWARPCLLPAAMWKVADCSSSSSSGGGDIEEGRSQKVVEGAKKASPRARGTRLAAHCEAVWPAIPGTPDALTSPTPTSALTRQLTGASGPGSPKGGPRGGERWVLAPAAAAAVSQGGKTLPRNPRAAPRWAPSAALQDRLQAVASPKGQGQGIPSEGEGESFGEALLVRHPADLAWAGLAYSVLDKVTHTQRQILHPSGGVVVPGEMMALVGPSGAGKSTLLDALAQRKERGRVSGRVFLNGEPAAPAALRAHAAYVAQEDVFVPTLSASETLAFHAVLRCGSGISKDRLAARMDRVLTVMGLSHVRNTQVGGALPGGICVRGLSGGERRRLSIACGLIGQPSLLFLDEPTSGLDSFAALNVMEHMACLAALGHTVVASIHQPRAAIWELFSKVVVLSQGHQLYFGAPQDAVEWFSGHLGYSYEVERDGAVSDWLMDLTSVGFAKPAAYQARLMSSVEDVVAAGERWRDYADAQTGSDARYLRELEGAARASDAKRGRRSGAHGRDLSVRPPVYAASWCTQFGVLLRRAVLAQLRNPTDVTSRLALSLYVGILAGLTFCNLKDDPGAAADRLSVIFFAMLVFELLPFCYMSIYNSDRRFFKADVAAGLYSTSAYFLAQTLSSLPFIVLNALCGGLVVYGLAGLRYELLAVLRFAALFVLQSLVAIQLMILCVYLTPNQDLAYVLATAYVTLSILLSGFYISLLRVTVQPMVWLSYLAYPRWVLQGFARTELAGKEWAAPGCFALGASGPPPGCRPLATGDGILTQLNFKLSVGGCFGVLVAFYAVFCAASFLALRVNTRRGS